MFLFGGSVGVCFLCMHICDFTEDTKGSVYVYQLLCCDSDQTAAEESVARSREARDMRAFVFLLNFQFMLQTCPQELDEEFCCNILSCETSPLELSSTQWTALLTLWG